MKTSKSSGERGSALLIIFVMAAAVAIMLYMEMPVAAFEAQRSKEQLLIDRGNEYAHAAKLYFRKFHTYPPTFDAMENTNRMRFLRKRYKDPFTGKDDWRLLHAAPNGMLTDSKVKPVSNNNIAGIGNSNPNANNQNAGNSSFGGFNSPSNSSFNSSSSPSGFGGFNASSSSSTGSSGAEVVVPALPQRRPAVAANQEANGATSQEMPAADSAFLNAGLSPAPASGGTDPNAQANNSQPSNLQPAANGQVPGPNAIDPNNPLGVNRGPGANQNPALPQTPGANPAGTAQGTSPFRQSPFSSGSGSTSGLGVMQGGGGLGIAGVASIAKGHSIKTVNDQEDYSLWEFYYDPTKDTMQAAAGALAQMGGGQQSGIGQASNSSTNSSSGFGGGLSGMQNRPNSGFGQQGSTSGGFGSFGNSGTSTSNTFGNNPPTTSSSTPTNPPQQ